MEVLQWEDVTAHLTRTVRTNKIIRKNSRRSGEQMKLEAMAVKIPHVEEHPNRVPFEGVLTVVNTASDKAPAGARGHRVMLTREAAEKALPSLLGMAVDYRPGWDGHDARRKIGSSPRRTW